MELQVKIGDEWQPKYIVYFGIAMMGLMLITNVLNLKFISLFGFTIIASLITYTLSLILADIMAEVYGYKRVRRVLYACMSLLALYATCLQIAVILPPAPDYINNEAFKALFSLTPRLAIASIISYFVTDMVASFLMSRLKIHWHTRYFYGRAVISVGIAQAAGGTTFFILAFAGVMPVMAIISAVIFNWTVIMICEFCVLPLTKKMAVKMKHIEGVEHYDFAPAEKIIRA